MTSPPSLRSGSPPRQEGNWGLSCKWLSSISLRYRVGVGYFRAQSMSILGIGLLLLQVQAGNVSGIVTKPGGTEPLPGAIVILNPANSSQTSRIRSTISEDDGRFAIQDIEPGDYRLQAQSAQYGNTAYGQRKPD